MEYSNLYRSEQQIAPVPFLETTQSEGRKYQDKAILAGNVLIFTVGLLRLFPKAIFSGLANIAGILETSSLRSSIAPQVEHFRNLAQKDRKSIDRKMVRWQGVAFLLQNLTSYQTAWNANQPSMLLCQGLATTYQTGALHFQCCIPKSVLITYGLISRRR